MGRDRQAEKEWRVVEEGGKGGGDEGREEGGLKEADFERLRRRRPRNPWVLKEADFEWPVSTVWAPRGER